MEYQEALDWLLDLEVMGIKLGLTNVRELLSRLGDPQRQFRSVHVAGTNGKGSVSAMTASILKAQGYRTALYTSPHMVDFRERVQVDGLPISRKQLCRLAKEVKGQVDDMCLAKPEACPTFFEVTTALAFLHFAELGTELAVVEVGMGG
jgi:dihydrofolate synthase / folylpolyglutamate synthase